MVQVLVVRVDIGVVIYEAMTTQCGKSVVQVLVVRVDIGVVIYEGMTTQCERSVFKILVVRVVRLMTYIALTSHCGVSLVHMFLRKESTIVSMFIFGLCHIRQCLRNT